MFGSGRRRSRRRPWRWWRKGRNEYGYLPGYGSSRGTVQEKREEFWAWCEVVWLFSIVPMIISDALFHSYLAHCAFMLILLVSQLLLLSQIGVVLSELGFVLRRLFELGLTLFLFVQQYNEILDLPAYFRHETLVAQGYPQFVYNPVTYKGHTTYYDLYIQGTKFNLPIDYDNVLQYEDKYFVIHYLPKSHYVLDYQMNKR